MHGDGHDIFFLKRSVDSCTNCGEHKDADEMEKRKWCCWGNDDSLPLIIHVNEKRKKVFSDNEENGKGEIFFWNFYLNNIIFLNIIVLFTLL
ncbi:hypothetical protein DI44_10150 [Geobacillus sp. CAMR5420]|nr:hypothetical protein DI44_10150 [Geobacillus sp. CAMR5420]OQP17084.1 hypothetical protein B1693_05720 [Geobacillus zalihae]